MKNTGIIFNIQKFSIHDGPGIRTTVFFKGCPLKCKWCSNPESQLNSVRILWDQNKCSHCISCINNCPAKAIKLVEGKIIIDHQKCIGCLNCVNQCPQSALKNEGEQKTINEIVNICLQDKDFYEESNGGVTISGGEGMAQPEFLFNLVKELKKHQLHIAIETTGYIEYELFTKLAPLFDLLLFDVKQYERNKHFLNTGVYNDLIIKNLKWAVENKLTVLPRIPVIPEFNDSLDDAAGLVKLLKECKVSKVQLLPFHQFGEKKYEMLNLEYSFKNKKALHQEDLKDYQNVFINNGIHCFF